MAKASDLFFTVLLVSQSQQTTHVYELTVVEAASPGSWSQHGDVLVRAIFWVAEGHLLIVSLQSGRDFVFKGCFSCIVKVDLEMQDWVPITSLL